MFQKLTEFERHRLEAQRDTLQVEWNLRNEKLVQLRQALAIEASAAYKFQLKQQVEAEEKELEQLQTKLKGIEQKLQASLTYRAPKLLTLVSIIIVIALSISLFLSSTFISRRSTLATNSPLSPYVSPPSPTPLLPSFPSPPSLSVTIMPHPLFAAAKRSFSSGEIDENALTGVYPKTELDNAEDYFDRGMIRYNLGDKQGAIADYDQAIKLKPDYALAYYNRGLAYQALVSKLEAIADFQKAVELYQAQGNNDEWLKKALERIKELQQ